MKTIKTLLILSSLFFLNYICAQQIEITEKNIINVFKKTIDQESRTKIRTFSNPWTSDNSSDIYFKSDTITFTNSKNNNFCKDINWTFYRKNKFIRTFGNHCEEPPTYSATKIIDYFEIKFREIGEKKYLELYNQEKLIEKFEIISLETTQSLSYKNVITYSLKLRRENI
ncbi:hypothetical protein [Epilithonimonas sp. UC225_85]|uniref:hypothetical protein n=1 Tax=Epilithonimonas sp. UC225_85 TaxID=3350167 RepID=UPI0036D3B51A